MTEWQVPEPRICVACGVRHMPESLMLACLEREVIRLRAEVEPMRRLRAEVRAMAPSHVDRRGR